MEKSAVFFDIDGTLWDYTNKIPDSTIEAIHRYQSQGGLAFISTGRTRATIQDRTLLGIGFDGILAGCGTYIEYRDRVMMEYLIPYEKLMRSREIFDRHHIWAFYEGSENLYIDQKSFGEDPYAVSFREKLGEHFKDVSDLDENSRINKLSIDYRETTREDMVDALKDEYDLIIHDFPGSYVTELVPHGYSKATSIEWICSHMDIPLENTYAFGDSANDIDMIRYAGHGIAMGNGSDSVKEAADYVTTPMKEDGIYNGMKAMGLI